jgi:hypothetical protein
MPFLIKPFEKQTSIRSVLGLMSIATKWGDYLFPGITVLTRDLHDVAALHRFIGKNDLWPPSPAFQKVSRRSSDKKVGVELARILRANRLPIPITLTQQMTFWQRYGSFFKYFDLISRGKSRSIDSYRRLVFSGTLQRIPDDARQRGRRIRHFEWYRAHRARLLVNLHEDVTKLRARSWWLTGEDTPPRAPIGIALSRRLEFCFIIWQTAFESAAWLLHHEHTVPRYQPLESARVEHFVNALFAARDDRSPKNMRRLLQLALSLHDSRLRRSMRRWHDDVARKLDPGADINALTLLHNQESIATFANKPASELLESLAELHTHYAYLQNKPHAISVKSFRHQQIGPRLPDITAEFGTARWGLHGYRLEAAVTLYESPKYRN